MAIKKPVKNKILTNSEKKIVGIEDAFFSTDHTSSPTQLIKKFELDSTTNERSLVKAFNSDSKLTLPLAFTPGFFGWIYDVREYFGDVVIAEAPRSFGIKNTSIQAPAKSVIIVESNGVSHATGNSRSSAIPTLLSRLKTELENKEIWMGYFNKSSFFGHDHLPAKDYTTAIWSYDYNLGGFFGPKTIESHSFNYPVVEENTWTGGEVLCIYIAHDFWVTDFVVTYTDDVYRPPINPFGDLTHPLQHYLWEHHREEVTIALVKAAIKNTFGSNPFVRSKVHLINAWPGDPAYYDFSGADPDVFLPSYTDDIKAAAVAERSFVTPIMEEIMAAGDGSYEEIAGKPIDPGENLADIVDFEATANAIEAQIRAFYSL